jgi:hypothetical protein
LFHFDLASSSLQPISGQSRNFPGGLRPNGFSDDGRFLIFEGTVPMLPNANNPDGEVFVKWLAPTAKR